MPRDNELPARDTDPDALLKKAKRMAMHVYNVNATREIYPPITEDQIVIVWFSKVLQNWKAMVTTTVPLESAYFEVTYNGDKNETYVDMYFKHSNTVITRLD